MQYIDFLETKSTIVEPVGFDVEVNELNNMLFDWQKDITRWALARGRSAVFLDTGLGKTAIQLCWADEICRRIGGSVLIVAPLAVSRQTAREADKFKIKTNVSVCKTGDDVIEGINITNYERLHYFDSSDYTAIVLDESSILKGFSGKVRQQITSFAKPIKYRMACTATPAPNDLIEISNHAEFLDVLTGKEIIALFFRQDGNTTHKWKLKGHAKEPFWEWMARWSVAIRKPSDIGYEDNGFILPPLNHVSHTIGGKPAPGELFVIEARTMQERRDARRETIEQRCKMAADIVNKTDDDTAWIIWCDLNDESAMLTELINGAVEIRGSNTPEYKEKAMIDFSDGKIKRLVSKSSICGFGMNWQHCHNMAFVGLSDSFESMYQATRRCWRFGQKRQVNVHVITADTEGAVVKNIKRKETQANELFDRIVQNMNIHVLARKQRRNEMKYESDHISGATWDLYLGDSCEIIKSIASETVGLTVFSPPFPGMYSYTDSARDVGNSKNIEQLLVHFEYLVPELLRVTMPGRTCAIHLTQEPIFKKDEGYSGIRDFRGDVIRVMQRHGWIYASERAIDKDPQLKAARTKDHGLAMKTAAKDSSVLTGTMADYLLQFRKRGNNTVPIRALIDHQDASKRNPDGWMTREEWIQWASCVWYGYHRIKKGGIRETDVLPVYAGKEDDDEKHLCPLQLGVIERCIKLWSAPDDIVLDPFAGIGSTPYQAVKYGRKAIGIELKPSYFNVALNNMRSIDTEKNKSQFDLFANTGESCK